MKPRALILLALFLIIVLVAISWFRKTIVPKLDAKVEVPVRDFQS